MRLLPWVITLGGILLLSRNRRLPNQLTKDFRLDEFAPGEIVKAYLTPDIIANVKALAKTLQRARNKINFSIRITSAVRTPAHNAAIGGVPNSQHTFGMAVDVQPIPNTTENAKKLWDALTSGTYDQLIWENAPYPNGLPSHIHFSYVRPGSRNAIYKTNRKKKLLYLNGTYTNLM